MCVCNLYACLYFVYDSIINILIENNAKKTKRLLLLTVSTLILLRLYTLPYWSNPPFLPERDYVTFGSLLSQFCLSSVCLSVCLSDVCL